ncbi:hypothetical protein [uncultured Tateyamaria sp.]|uniref:hypothetical protein n=1 Tax=uncultured Tateyamaria sp. TaxID=455651 RepID=UPI002635976C|nr:hypothetical protein [uncultured Tateyamaria sp.]
MAGLRRARSAVDAGTPASLGFLDVNFGVLGIFIIIFAIRIMMIQSQSAYPFDAIVLVHGSEDLEMGRAVIHMAGELVEINKEIDRLYDVDNTLGSSVRAFFSARVATLQTQLKVGFVLLPEGFDTMKAINATLSAEAAASGEGFLPLEFTIIPAADAEEAQAILAAWEESNG